MLLAVELRGAHRFEAVVVRRRYQDEGIPTLCAASGAAQPHTVSATRDGEATACAAVLRPDRAQRRTFLGLNASIRAHLGSLRPFEQLVGRLHQILSSLEEV